MAMIFVSCAPQKPAIERNYFILETYRDQAHHQNVIPGALAIRDFSVSPGFQGREMVYRTGKNKVHADFHNYYFVLPGPMLSQQARSWFKDAGLFESIIPMSSHLDADYILEGAVSSIYGDYQVPGQPAGVVAINFLLLKNTESDFEIVFQKKYRTKNAADGTDAGSIVQALSICIEEILSLLENDIAEAMIVQ